MQVSRFESNLLKILHCLLGRSPVEHVLPLIQRPIEKPICLSRNAVDLVQSTLARGVVTLLTRGGAWKREQHLRDDSIVEGSLWQRSAPEDLGLKFSANSLDFLIWLTASDTSAATAAWVPRPMDGRRKTPLTFGDQFLLFLATRSLRDLPMIAKWLRSEGLRDNALVALTMPDVYAEHKRKTTPDFDPWMTGVGACVLEAMQEDLAETWKRLERYKSKISTPDRMSRLGEAQQVVINALFDSAQRHGRRDLCRFINQAAHELLSPSSNKDHWIEKLDTSDLRLAERTEVYTHASSFLRTTKQLQAWHAESQGVGYFDEGYVESQLWKTNWESLGMDQVVAHADRVLAELEF